MKRKKVRENNNILLNIFNILVFYNGLYEYFDNNYIYFNLQIIK